MVARQAPIPGATATCVLRVPGRAQEHHALLKTKTNGPGRHLVSLSGTPSSSRMQEGAIAGRARKEMIRELATVAGQISDSLKALARQATPRPNRALNVHFGRFHALEQELNVHGRAASGQDRVLQYLLRRVGKPVPRVELARVAGIAEWARRVRELRIEHGWPIDSLQGGRAYVLKKQRPNPKAAADWRELNRIRRSSKSTSDKLLCLLKYRLRKPVPRAEIAYVAGIREAQRRLRELDEKGWQIRSERQDASLHRGAYMLASLRRAKSQFRVPLKAREAYLRKHPSCSRCGAKKGDKGRWLEVDHIRPIELHRKSKLNPNRDKNLQTLCNVCHAGKTAGERAR